jgi:hypothetical protein
MPTVRAVTQAIEAACSVLHVQNAITNLSVSIRRSSTACYVVYLW